MKKFFSLVLALVMALSLTTVAWGADLTATPADFESVVASAPAGSTIQLTAGDYPTLVFQNITASDLTIVGGTGVTVGELRLVATTNYGAPDNLTVQGITFNGYGIRGVDETITGLSVIGCTFTAGAVMHLNGPTTTDLLVTGCTFGATDYATTGQRTAVLIQGAVSNINIVDNDFEDIEYNAIQLPGDVSGTVVLSDNTIDNTGDRAIRLGDVQSGATLTITNNTVTNCGSDEAVKATSIAADVTVNAWNNEWDGTVVNAELADIGTGVTTDASGKFTAGTFAAAPAAADVATGYEVVELTSGAYSVVPATTGSASAAEYALWKADVTATTAVVAKGNYETVAATTNAADGSGTLEYVKMGGKLFVKVPANKATTQDFYVCGANDKTKTPLFYLKQIDSVADVSYVLSAVKFTDFGVKCGQMNAAYVDITTNEAGFYVFTNPVTGAKMYFTDYVALNLAAPYYGNSATKTVTIVNFGNILVDGKIVKAYLFSNMSGVATSPLNAHVWAPSAYDKTTPVKALCGICGAQANLYKDNKIPAKSIVDAVLNLGGTNYNVVITSTGSVVVPSTPSTDKTVTSADTFDAGIAMYVGMSIMAAAGGAVVIGKKKD